MCINPTSSGKSRTVDAHVGKLEGNLIPRINNPNPAKQQYDCIVEPINTTKDGKAYALKAQYSKSAATDMTRGGCPLPSKRRGDPRERDDGREGALPPGKLLQGRDQKYGYDAD